MDKKVSQLVEATTLNDADVLPIVNGGETKKVTIATIKDQANVKADWNATSGASQILNKPTIPSAQVNSDWNSASGVSQILNKPTIPSPQVNSDWNASSGLAQILNKPTIPSAVTQTSQLTNNGADGVNPFITALDIPTQNQASTLVREVKNMTGATLTKGTIVYISGANGNKPLVSKAKADTDATSARTFGLLQSDILNNGLGNCVIIGDLSGLDTSAFADGTQLYLSGTTAGTYTSTKPVAPIHLVYVGKVTRSHPTLGQIEVGIQNGYELEEIHDVLIDNLFDGDVLQYETASGLWKNKYFLINDSDFATSVNTFNALYLDFALSALQNQLDLKMPISTWQDYSSTSTIVGWNTGTYTQKIIRYLVVGKMMIIEYFISGTSNSATTSFTFPQTSANITGMIWANNNQVVSGLSNYMGFGNISASTNIVTFGYYPTGSSITTTWGTTNTKTIRGMITFELA